MVGRSRARGTADQQRPAWASIGPHRSRLLKLPGDRHPVLAPGRASGHPGGDPRLSAFTRQKDTHHQYAGLLSGWIAAAIALIQALEGFPRPTPATPRE